MQSDTTKYGVFLSIRINQNTQESVCWRSH